MANDPPVRWRKASGSNQGADCVEVADLSDGVAVRDSKDPDGPMLTLTRCGWAELAAMVKAGRSR